MHIQKMLFVSVRQAFWKILQKQSKYIFFFFFFPSHAIAQVVFTAQRCFIFTNQVKGQFLKKCFKIKYYRQWSYQRLTVSISFPLVCFKD